MSDIFEERTAFNFYKSYYKTSLLLDAENRAEFLDCILHYQFTGELKEPKLPFASLAFNGQIHSLQKQVNGYIKGKSTYPTGNPTKGEGKANDKGKGKEVQVQEEVQVQDKGKKKEENHTSPTAFSFYKSLISLGAESKLANEWMEVRKKKKSTNTETALNGFIREMEKCNLEINEALRICVEKSWAGLNSNWIKDSDISKPNIIQGETLEEKAYREHVEQARKMMS